MTELKKSHLRCKVTSNICGIDTWIVGHSCQCENCLEYLIHRDHLRIGIAEKHDFDERENDISNNAGRLYFEQREIKRAEMEEIDKIRKIVIPASHTGRLAEGKS